MADFREVRPPATVGGEVHVPTARLEYVPCPQGLEAITKSATREVLRGHTVYLNIWPHIIGLPPVKFGRHGDAQRLQKGAVAECDNCLWLVHIGETGKRLLIHVVIVIVTD